MIIDIDNSKSVQAAVSMISEGWFDPAAIYVGLKAQGSSDLADFWNITTHLLNDIAGILGLTSAQFLDGWDQRCIDNSTSFMGYHCTRHSDKQVFIDNGILPLSEETIKLSEDKNQTARGKSMWEYRSQRSRGPWFLLSYKCAKSPENHFCHNGPEILLGCVGLHIGVDPAKSRPIIVHCAIPYSLLSEKNYFAFCVLRAYFNFLDPDDNLNDLFDGYSIDLEGKVLCPRFILRIEEI